jgi:hypothetical protein
MKGQYLIQKNGRKEFSLLIFFICITLLAKSVTPVWSWGHIFNGKISAIEYHNDFIYTAGTFSDSAFIVGNINIANNGGNDIIIAKWDTMGNLIWANTIYGAADEQAVSIKVNSNNELLIAGNSNSATINTGGNVLTSNGGYDYFIAKYNLNGTFISSNIYGTAGPEAASDMCVDYMNNIYVFFAGGLIYKYSPSGVYTSQASFPQAQEMDYSKLDSSLVLTGTYTGSLTLGNFTINAQGNLPNIYCLKISLSYVPLWLKGLYRSNVYGVYSAKTAADPLSGNTYISKTAWYPISMGHFEIYKINQAGTLSIVTDDYDDGTSVPGSICAINNLVSVGRTDLNSLSVYDYNLNNMKIYEMCGHVSGLQDYHLLRSINTIYTLGYEQNNIRKFGKIGHEILISGPGNQSITACDSNLVTLNGNIYGGVPPLTYSWLPVTGLNNTNTNSVSFTATSNISYTLTVTDNIGQTAKDTFNVTVNPNSSSLTNISICANQTPYLWNGQSFDSTGSYTVNLVNAYGCDSAAMLNLNVSPCIVCVPDFTINYSPFYNSLTESQSWIVTSGTVLVLAGTNVKLDANANSYVTLNPGFKADSGSVFVAQAYNGCTAGAPQLPNAKIFRDPSAAADEIVLYPNPTSGMIHISHDEKLTGIQIFDMVGKLIVNQKCEGETETNIDLSNLPNGVYLVKAAGYNSVKVIKNN